MKFKVSYIYLAVLVIAVILLVVLTQKENTPAENTASSQLPNDDIHKGMQNNEGSPSGGNVNQDVIRKMQELKEASEKNPNDTAKIREYADFLAMAHKQDDAIILYERILKKNPKRIDILFSMAFVYYNKQNISKSEEITYRILSIDKDNLQAKYNLGALAATKGDNEKARQMWSAIIKDYPGTQESQLAESSLKQLK